MAATFNPSLPTQRDHIRLHLGDIHNQDVAGSITDALLQDEVIDANLQEFGYLETLARLAESLAAMAAQEPTEYNQQQHGVQVKWADRIKVWMQLARQARAGTIPVPNQKRLPRRLAAVANLHLQDTLTDASSQFRSD